MYKGLNLIMPGTTSRITCHGWANRLQLRFRENLLVLTDFQTREDSVEVGLSQNAQGTIYTLPEIPLRSAGQCRGTGRSRTGNPSALTDFKMASAGRFPLSDLIAPGKSATGCGFEFLLLLCVSHMMHKKYNTDMVIVMIVPFVSNLDTLKSDSADRFQEPCDSAVAWYLLQIRQR